MKTKIFNLCFMALCIIALLGCFPMVDTTPQEVEANINNGLKPGDNAQKIEEYLVTKKLDASYDGFSSRYQGIIRHPNSNFHAIVFYIYVDKNKTFVNVEAHDSYTFI